MSSVLTPEFYSSIIQHTNDMICIITTEGLYKYVNNAVSTKMGYAYHDLIDKSALHYIHPDDLPDILGVLQDINHAGQIKVKPFRFLHQNGGWRWLSLTLTNMLDNPAICGLVTNCRDITEEVEANTLLSKKEAYYSALFFNHPDLVFTLNEQGIIESSNAKVANILGYTTGETWGQHFAQYVAPTHLEEALQAFRKVIENGAHTFETRIVDKNKQLLDLSVTLVPVWLHGRITAVHCVAKDITQVKQAERLLREQAVQLNNILGSITDSFFALNKHWQITYANPTFAKFLKLPAEKLLKRNIWQETPDLISTHFYRKCMEVMVTGRPTEYEEYIGVLGTITNYRIYPFEEGIAVCFTDISAKKAAEEELKKLSLVASKTTNGVLITCKNGLIEWANNSFLNLTGYTLAEIENKDPLKLLQGPDTNQEALQNLRRLLVLGIPFSEELLTYKKNGEKVWIAADITPILDDEGKIEKLIILYTDISERKFAETKLLQLNENLVQQNSDLRQFTYIVSHNLRAPVANIVGLTRLLAKLDASSAAFSKAVQNLDISVQRLDNVIHDLSKIVSIKTPENTDSTEPVNLRALSTEIAQSLHETTIAIKATIDLQIDKNLTIYTKRAYLYSILHNLFTNSIKYRSDERPLLLQLQVSKAQNGSLLIKVTDNGLGMDMDVVRPNIFKLYNRFHVHTEGRGLGLYLVKSQVEALGGSIEVESEKGLGTRFYIQFRTPRYQ